MANYLASQVNGSIGTLFIFLENALIINGNYYWQKFHGKLKSIRKCKKQTMPADAQKNITIGKD